MLHAAPKRLTCMPSSASTNLSHSIWRLTTKAITRVGRPIWILPRRPHVRPQSAVQDPPRPSSHRRTFHSRAITIDSNNRPLLYSDRRGSGHASFARNQNQSMTFLLVQRCIRREARLGNFPGLHKGQGEGVGDEVGLPGGIGVSGGYL